MKNKFNLTREQNVFVAKRNIVDYIQKSANIDNGCGIITITQKNQPIFFEKLIKYYETNDNKDLKEGLYKTSIDGINLQNIIQKNYIMFFLFKKKLITDK